jgi:hypothetical protein
VIATPVVSVDPEADAVTASGGLPEEGVTVSAATGCPTVSWAVAWELFPAVSVTVTVTVKTPPLA